MTQRDVLRETPVSEGGASGEEDSFGFGLGLVKEAEERVVLHTDLPEDLTLVPAAHQELQRVLMGALETRRSHTQTHTDVIILREKHRNGSQVQG